MQKNQLACFNYPTTVVLVDDSQAFLSNMRLKLAKNYATLLYQDPQEALSDINDKQPPFPSGEKLFESYSEDGSNNEQAWSKTVAINIRNIYRQVYNPNRFLDISTVVVDYSMPHIDGISFCENLKSNPIRKIMLTGKAGNDIAVAAFNKGIIDKFLVKDTEKTIADIHDAIKTEQQSFFYNSSKPVLEILKNQGINILNNINFIKLFSSICERVKACEFYLLDLSGSFLLLDIDAKPTFFLVKSNNEIENYYQIAKDSEAPQTILEDLKTHKKLPFFFTDEDEQISPKFWQSILYSTQPLDSENFYFYSIVEGPINGLNTSRIKSYKSFLKSFK